MRVVSAQSGPLFLIGAERSGTTLCRLMPDHHPAICWLGEFDYAIERVGDDGAVPSIGVVPDVARNASQLPDARVHDRSGGQPP